MSTCIGSVRSTGWARSVSYCTPTITARDTGAKRPRRCCGSGSSPSNPSRSIGRCDARNDASAQLIERLGMRREAHFRENEHFKGEWADQYVYAMLAAEWKARARL